MGLIAIYVTIFRLWLQGVMQVSRKRFVVCLWSVFACLHLGSASAAILSLNPSSATFSAADSVSVDLLVSGLAEGEVLATYDVFIDYDPSLLSIDPLFDVQFSDALGSELLGESLPLAFDFFGSVEVLNISLLTTSELAAIQTANPLLLATLTFTALDDGTSGFAISDQIVGFEVVPLPGALWLMITGLLGIGAMARKKTLTG